MAPWNLIGGVTLTGHGSYENFLFLYMIFACGFLTFDFEVM